MKQYKFQLPFLLIILIMSCEKETKISPSLIEKKTQLRSFSTHKHDGFKVKYEFKYDSLGRIIERYCFTLDSLTSITKFSYANSSKFPTQENEKLRNFSIKFAINLNLPSSNVKKIGELYNWKVETSNYKFNTSSKTLTIIDNNNYETIYQYDITNRLISKKTANLTTYFVYDSNGNVQSNSYSDSNTLFTYKYDYKTNPLEGILFFYYNQSLGQYPIGFSTNNIIESLINKEVYSKTIYDYNKENLPLKSITEIYSKSDTTFFEYSPATTKKNVQ